MLYGFKKAARIKRKAVDIMKEELKKQSINLFVEKGYSATSIKDIVATIGVTKGSFYYHFTSKEELLMDIHLHYINDLLTRQAVILEKNECYRDKLVKVVELLVYDIEKQGAIGRVYFREIRHLSPEHAASIRTKRASFRDVIEKLVEEGMAKGEFRQNLQPKIITFSILGIANWSYQWFNPEGTLSVKELANIYTDFILYGIQSKENQSV